LSTTVLPRPLLPPPDPTATPAVLRRVPGTTLLGPYQGSGFREDRYLVRRADGQVVLLSALLNHVLAETDGARDEFTIADAVTQASGRRLSVENLRYLVDTKLQPLGLISTETNDVPSIGRANPLLGLTLRFVLVPEKWVRRLSRVFAPLYVPIVPIVALVLLGLLDRWLFLEQGVGTALTEVSSHPLQLLAVFGLLPVSMLFHECGHAAACRYGGGRPGAIGAGLYLIMPAFYTNVTDSYRLKRTARLRTDLGGIYFNVIFILVCGMILRSTAWSPLAVLILLTHLEILQQLLPIVRLDGYYILSDIVGIPDLFARVRPVLVSVVRRRPHGKDVADLRPHVRVVVASWVAVTVPVLAAATILLFLRLPSMVRTSWDTLAADLSVGRSAIGQHHLATIALAAIDAALAVLPLVGLVIVAVRVGGRVGRRFTSLLAGQANTKEVSMPANSRSPQAPTAPPPPMPAWGPPLPSSATIFTEEAMLRPRARPPEGRWRRAVYALSGGIVNPGPSHAEEARRAVIARVKAPFAGSRRIVVLSRKGGAGKTTTTLMLGHLFASHRGDRVVALDANPDAGSLGHRVRKQTANSVTDMLAANGSLERYSDIRAYTSQAPSRLEVLASDDDPRITQRLGQDDYHRTVELLDRHYNLILIDTGTGILDAAIQGVLMEADQLVVVLPPALDGARVAAGTLDWLVQHGRGSLVRSTVVAINAVPKDVLVELDQVEKHFAARCAAVVRIPWDPVLAAGAATLPEELRPSTCAGYLNLAAAVADQFRLPSPRR
jgi:putative peptide zinc metalloprotease protein